MKILTVSTILCTDTKILTSNLFSPTGKKSGVKPDKKESKAKRPGSGKSQHSDEEEEKHPPPPLTISISVELHHWKTAQDSIPKQSLLDKMALIEEAIVE